MSVAALPIQDYEKERNKPMPNLTHGVIQTNITFALQLSYREEYMFPSELSLATKPSSTPDICIYPLKTVDRRTTGARESEAPITTIEIQSPSQSLEVLVNKAWDLYFPMGVKSAWIVIPALKAIQIILPNEETFLFTSDMVKDPITNIEIDIKEVFRGIK